MPGTLLLLALTVAGAPPAEAFVEQVETHFAAWDGDGNGELSAAEIDAAVADPQVRGPAAAAVAALKRASRNRRFQLPPLTLPNIKHLAAATPAADRPDLPGTYASGLARIEQANHCLFASGKPRLDTIHQGKLGNCFCLAPLGAVLHRDADRVVKMFHRQADGTFRVTLGERTVTVAAPTDAELAQTASNEQDGMWVNLYEKAVGIARLQDKPADGRQGSPIDALARGGSAGTMLAYITGHKIQRFSCAFAKDAALSADRRQATLDDLRAWLRDAAAQRRPMTCGTEKTTTPGLTPNHAYAVLGYDPDADTIQLWNPHGSNFVPQGEPGLECGYPRTDGVFSMPLPDFVEQFAGLAVETDLPAGAEPELPKLPRPSAEPPSR